ncbi:MAG: hypothetical protein JW753_06220 [Dehalococcoidia bacterium]|nr:hypothetical protein [Dehalococcoidia bacterium]
MLRRIVFSILAVVMVFAAGCKQSSDSSEGAWNLVYEAPDDVYYSALCFPDENNGWVVGWSGRILRTSDGGSAWETLDSGTTADLQCVCFVDDRAGWIGTRDGKIGCTTDSGASWTWEQPQGEADRIFMAMCFVDDCTGWIVDNRGGILHTEDGGATWLPQDSCADWCISSVQFLDHEQGWATGTGGILHTSDGGRTWTVSKTGLLLHPLVAISQDIYFVDGNSGWITTDIMASSDLAAYEAGAPLFHTTDGGKTWQVQASFLHEGHLSRVRFVDHNAGWVLGLDNLYYTQNGGGSWSSQPISGGLFEDISFADPLHPWVLSFEGKVYHYETD